MPTLPEYLEENHDSFEQALFELLRIPSVSTDPSYAAEVQRGAQWVLEQFKEMGLPAEIIEGDGHPIVYAESPHVPGAPVVLVYGHYDVQPPDPLDEWVTPPFEPDVRDGNVYARGATDDKGQMLTHVFSAKAHLAANGSLPVQLKFIIEGEEEKGSEVLEAYLAEAKERLACDCVVISDCSQFAPGQPAITYGLRGICYYELLLQGPKQDLHSGVFGGAVTNPAVTLSKMLGSLTDSDGRIQVPGFYDDLQVVTEQEREQFQALPFSERAFQEQIGVNGLTGESGYSTLERRWVRPSFDVHGLWSGYQKEGQKTVLPASAGAKFSFRIIPDQDPKKISAALEAFLEEQLPVGITMKLIDCHGAPGFVVPLDSPYMTAAATAIEHGFSRSPVFIREGGSIPIVGQFVEHLGADVLLLGWGRDDDNTHSPNEKFSLADFHRGIRSSAALWTEIAKIQS